VERHTGVPQAARESAEWQQWAEHLLEAVREGEVGHPGGTKVVGKRGFWDN